MVEVLTDDNTDTSNKRKKLNLLPDSRSIASGTTAHLYNSSEIVQNTIPSISFQVATGIIKPASLSNNVLVISQGWPSWTFALDGLGFKSIKTIASFSSIMNRDEFRTTSLGTTLLNRKFLQDWIATNRQEGIIFIQSDSSFFSATAKVLPSFESLKVIFVCTDINFFTAEGWRESHAIAGGITNGIFTCYAQHLRLPRSDHNALVFRTLKHVL